MASNSLKRRNEGKIFEENFRKSVPEDVFYYRFKDTASSYYGGNSQLRFSQSNIADNMLFYDGKLFINELKHHHGKSLPLNCIRDNQKEEMAKASVYEGIFCSLVVFFADVEECYSLDINKVLEFSSENERKSIPISYFEEFGTKIPLKKLQTNYRYDLSVLISTKKD